MPATHWLKYFYPFVFLSYCLDRITKLLALHFLEKDIIIIPRLLALRLVRNENTFFYWRVPYDALLFTVGIVLLLVIVILIVQEYSARHFYSTVLLVLIFTGAFSNLWDRLRFGYVIDFINVPFWATFNLADVYIVSAVLVWIFIMWRQKEI